MTGYPQNGPEVRRLGAFQLCAERVQQLGNASPLHPDEGGKNGVNLVAERTDFYRQGPMQSRRSGKDGRRIFAPGCAPPVWID